MLTAIYLLKDPRNNSIRYVGKSVSPKRRFRTHIRYGKKEGVKKYLYCWIYELYLLGMKPTIEIIEWVENWQERERYWIKHYSKLHRLTNLSIGGEGSCGYKHTKDWKLNASLRAKGRKPWNTGLKLSPEHRKKLSEAKRPRCSKEKALNIKLGTRRTPIEQYDLKGNLIATWQSPSHAAEQLGLKRAGIANCVYGLLKTYKKYKWKKK